MTRQRIAVIAAVLALMPAAAFAGKGGGGYVPPPPSCTAQYYCSGNDVFYQDSACNTYLNQTCLNGCANAACIPDAPSCTISLDAATIPYGSSTTLHWSSSGADQFYIQNVGYVSVTADGSAAVSSPGTYSGTVTNTGGTANCSATGAGDTLTVTPPPLTTAAITSSAGSSVIVGQPTTITATFSPGTGDQLSQTNIDMPEGTGVGANTNPDATKTYVFTPTAAGTYTFVARATTAYYSSWTSYATITITVPPPPTCTISISPTTVPQGESATLSWTSSNATGGTITHVGPVGPSGSVQIAPSQATTYSGTFTGTGGSAPCSSGPGGNPDGTFTLNVSCTPFFSCLNNDVIYVNGSCEVSTYAACTAPMFCTPGITSCQYPAPAFNADSTNGTSGHLQAKPLIVPAGAPSKLYWNISYVSGCTVSGTNGDSWTGVSSGATGKTTKGITQRTTFHLACTGLDSSAVDENTDINIVPIFQQL